MGFRLVLSLLNSCPLTLPCAQTYNHTLQTGLRSVWIYHWDDRLFTHSIVQSLLKINEEIIALVCTMKQLSGFLTKLRLILILFQPAAALYLASSCFFCLLSSDISAALVHTLPRLSALLIHGFSKGYQADISP